MVWTRPVLTRPYESRDDMYVVDGIEYHHTVDSHPTDPQHPATFLRWTMGQLDFQVIGHGSGRMSLRITAPDEELATSWHYRDSADMVHRQGFWELPEPLQDIVGRALKQAVVRVHERKRVADEMRRLNEEAQRAARIQKAEAFAARWVTHEEEAIAE